MTYTVKRNGEILMEEVRAHSEEDAIQQVQDRWSWDNFGQAGALTEHQISRENEYLNAEFTAEESAWYDPEECEECLAEAETSGFDYVKEFTWENGTWVCDHCGRPQ